MLTIEKKPPQNVARQIDAAELLRTRAQLTISETAALLGVSRDQIYRSIRNGLLSGRKMSSRIGYVTTASITKYLEAAT